jgi:hypothetical protein
MPYLDFSLTSLVRQNPVQSGARTKAGCVLGLQLDPATTTPAFPVPAAPVLPANSLLPAAVAPVFPAAAAFQWIFQLTPQVPSLNPGNPMDQRANTYFARAWCPDGMTVQFSYRGTFNTSLNIPGTYVLVAFPVNIVVRGGIPIIQNQTSSAADISTIGVALSQKSMTNWQVNMTFRGT